MKRILVCEDEVPIREFVVINLKRAGYDVVDVCTGDEALEVFAAAEKANEPFDIALLDIMMPGENDGASVCKILREKNRTLGIIMLSAKVQEMDKVNCLMNGADDYVTKPFSLSELIARVDAVHRRVEIAKPDSSAAVSAGNEKPLQEIDSGPFRINLEKRTFSKNGTAIDMTQVEYHILEFFMRNPGIALDRKSILTSIWGETFYGDEKVIDVNIHRLRTKIEDDPSKPTYIRTVWGYGYKWGENEIDSQ
ncbi:MAG: response regulator transcription factor [Oscillospiraceae bacterium]|nr:response regulator transcription factor [Oscillospiraceae bacterium]